MKGSLVRPFSAQSYILEGFVKATTGRRETCMQGVIKSYDPNTKDGVVMSERDFIEYELAPTALEGSIFRMLRQGQRVIFDLEDSGLATNLRLGSEVDMGTPDFLQ